MLPKARHINFEIDAGIATIALDRPDRKTHSHAKTMPKCAIGSARCNMKMIFKQLSSRLLVATLVPAVT